MRFLALSILLPVAAGVALAAQPVPQQPREMSHPMPDFAKIRQQRADDLALLIGLRADQRPALDAMMTAMEPPHRDWGKPGDRPMPPEPGADESFSARLDHMSQHIDKKDAEAKRKIEAVRSFYASLDPDQKRRFEALDRLRHSDPAFHHGMHGHGMGHGHGPDGPPPRG
jgi:periplasmic protein CpxP/Spy